MRNQSDMLDIQPNNTKSASSSNVNNHGSQANTNGSHIGAASNAIHVTSGCIKASRFRPLKPGCSSTVINSHMKHQNPTYLQTSQLAISPLDPASLQTSSWSSVAPNEHAFQETTGHLKRTKCNLAVHKRAKEETFKAFVDSPCIDEAYTQPHQGHPAHTLWQQGKSIKRKGCGLQSHLDEASRAILTRGLRNKCRGKSQNSPTLDQLFGAQAKRKESPTGHDTPPTLETPLQLHHWP